MRGQWSTHTSTATVRGLRNSYEKDLPIESNLGVCLAMVVKTMHKAFMVANLAVFSWKFLDGTSI